MDYIIPIGLTILGVALLIAALKAALGPDNKQHRRADGGTVVGDGYSHNSRNGDNDCDSGGDSGSDGGGD